MSELPPLFMTSGDLIADRRVELARQYQAAGDLAAAADLFAQAVERAPQFAWGWFLLGAARRALGDRTGAIAAYEQARAHDPVDRLGAGLQLARLSAADPAAAMSGGYVRALFDQYAPRFDAALAELSYQAPQLLLDAVMATGARHFARALDLGCGTGLAARAFGRHVDAMHGVDLSPRMIAQAERTGLYGALDVDDMLAFLQRQNDASADLVIAADALVYLADLAPLLREVGRVLAAARTVRFHGGDASGRGRDPRREAALRACGGSRACRARAGEPRRDDVRGRLDAHRGGRAGSRPAGGGAAMNISVPPELPEVFTRWFAARGWAPRAHQLELLRVARAGRSALLIAPTGAGKTLAGFLPSLVELSAEVPRGRSAPLPSPSKTGVDALMAAGGVGGGGSRKLVVRYCWNPPPPTPPRHALRARGEGRRPPARRSSPHASSSPPAAACVAPADCTRSTSRR